LARDSRCRCAARETPQLLLVSGRPKNTPTPLLSLGHEKLVLSNSYKTHSVAQVMVMRPAGMHPRRARHRAGLDGAQSASQSNTDCSCWPILTATVKAVSRFNPSAAQPIEIAPRIAI